MAVVPPRRRVVLWAAVAALGACVLSPDEILPPVPPGQDIAYAGFGVGFRYDIYLLSADARTDTNLTLASSYDFWPSWAPDGSQFAFESNRPDSLHRDILIFAMATSAVTQVTFDSGSFNLQPAWSPTGTRIAFASDRDNAGLDIYLMDVDGGNVKRLTSDSADSAQPTWSPTGDRLAFVSDRGGNVDIYVMDTLGGAAVNITNDAAGDFAPAWSPDGARIAFHSEREPSGFAIWIMDTTGANATRITPTNPDCELPDWSPDGQRIAYDCDGDIWVSDPAGGNRVRITRTSNTQRLEVMARWRPAP
jgi:Tol biopolymer transport system component